MIRRKAVSLVPQGDETIGTTIAPWHKSYVKDAHVYGDLTVDGQVNVTQIGTIVELGPLADGGVVLREVSDDPQLVSDVDGQPGSNAVPTQAAVTAFVNEKVTNIGETLSTVDNSLTVQGDLTVNGEINAPNSEVALGEVTATTLVTTQGGHVPNPPSNAPNGSLLVRDDSETIGYAWKSTLADPVVMSNDVTVGTDDQQTLTVNAKSEFRADVDIGTELNSADLRVYGDLLFPQGGQLLGQTDLATTTTSGVVKLNKNLSVYENATEDDRVPTAKTVFDALQTVSVQDATLSQKGVVQLSNAFDGDVESDDDEFAATTQAVKNAHAVADSALSGLSTKEDQLTFQTPLTRAANEVSVQAATTSSPGVVQLSNSFSSTSETTAATSNGLKTVYDEAYGLAETAKDLAENKQDPFTPIAPLDFTNNDTQLTVFSATPSARGVVVTSSDPSDIQANVTTKIVAGITTGVAATPALVNEAYTLAGQALTDAKGHGLTLEAPLQFDSGTETLSVTAASTSEPGVVQLSDAVDNDSSEHAASSLAVKTVQNDLNVEKGKIVALQTGKQDGITFPNESPLGFDGTNLTITNASTAAKGVVRLTNTVDNREDLAVTPLGVKGVNDRVDQRIPLSGTTQITGDLATTGSHYHIGSSDFRSFSLATNGIRHLTVAANGNVGISELQPQHPLHVDGLIFTTETVTESSDQSTKTNIAPIADPVSKISSIQGVTFSPILYPTKQEVGVLAQDVEAVLPEAVTTNAQGQKSVAYGRLVGLLIEGMKEMNATIQDLQTRLAKVEESA